MLSSKRKRDALRTIPIYQNAPFEFNDGWFQLIYDLGKKITDYCNHNDIPLPKVKQIKEKFGTLRFYCQYDGDRDKTIAEWINQAEEASETICETCGDAGELMVDDGKWYLTCKEHQKPNSITAEKYSEERNELARAKRKCDVCGEGYADGYFNNEKFVNRCKDHKEDLLTSDEYISKRQKEKSAIS